MIDDVVVGHRVAVRRDEEAGAFAGDGLMALRAVAVLAGLVTELIAELLEELVERRARLCRNLLLIVVAVASCSLASWPDPRRRGS